MAIGDGSIGAGGSESLLTKMQSLVKDTDAKLEDADWDAGISAALARYSKHRPYLVVEDIAGTGLHDYDVPSEWVKDFSSLEKVEYPVDKIPEEDLDSEDFKLYEAVAGSKIRLITCAPSVGTSFRVSYTTPRDEDTIAANDFDAVAHLAASVCLGMLASRYVSVGDSTIQADVVNYRTKSQEAAARAKTCLTFYNDHLGIKDDGTVPAASAVVSATINYPGGSDRLTHPRRLRNLR